jgi:hypothetical protein
MAFIVGSKINTGGIWKAVEGGRTTSKMNQRIGPMKNIITSASKP